MDNKQALEVQKNLAIAIEENAKLWKENVTLKERQLMKEEGKNLDELDTTLTENMSDT